MGIAVLQSTQNNFDLRTATPQTRMLAVHNRRECRRLRSYKRKERMAAEAAANVYARRCETEARAKRFALRMCCRFFPDQIFLFESNDIRLDRKYWLARRCGWDAFSKQMRSVRSSFKIHDANSSPFWMWWTGLGYETRDSFCQDSFYRLTVDRTPEAERKLLSIGGAEAVVAVAQ